MDALFHYFSSQLAISLFLIIGLGLALGNLSFYGLSLGTSAILFVALIFGHFGVQLPPVIGDLGVILFVYCIGLQVGPRFFHSLVSKGLIYFWIALISLLLTACVTISWIHFFNLSPYMGIGLFAGALASTPGLAASLDIVNDPSISVGFSLSYPFGILSVLLFVHYVSGQKQTKDELRKEMQDSISLESKLATRQFIITNPNCTGKPLVEIHFHGMAKANITRIKRGETVFMAHDDSVLKLNDVVMAVGTPKELKKLEHILGSETQEKMDLGKEIAGRDVFVSSLKIAGKTLEELEIKELFGVVITRLRRDSLEIVPGGATTLEIGDLIHVVGDQEDCDRFVEIVGQQERRIQETNLLPLALGIVAGTMLGIYPFQLPGGIKFHLGMAGGPLLVALVIGHYGRIGRVSTRVPYAAKYITREIGLAFFLAVVGTKAGDNFFTIFMETGGHVLLLAALTSLTAILSSFGLATYVFRFSHLASIGVVCGAMTNTPSLSVVTSRIDSDTPTIAYASIYAISLVLITVFSQILALVLI